MYITRTNYYLKVTTESLDFKKVTRQRIFIIFTLHYTSERTIYVNQANILSTRNLINKVN